MINLRTMLTTAFLLRVTAQEGLRKGHSTGRESLAKMAVFLHILDSPNTGTLFAIAVLLDVAVTGVTSIIKAARK